MVRYAELHCHTNFSFLDGASHPQDLAQRAADLGYEALAVTDHDGFYGAARFRLAAADVGLPTVYGVEVGLPRRQAANSKQLTANRQRLSRGRERDHPPPSPPSAVLPPTGGERRRPRRGRTVRAHGTKPLAVPATDHLVLLAPDPAGYAAISRLVSQAQFRGEKDRPVYDYDDL
ncbi:MAG TPA: PHP domain-containing protein, partial [Acidimicrobiia bacterium]|nr:PHP domain-containing protein [Acidimicrobiia bacterium]